MYARLGASDPILPSEVASSVKERNLVLPYSVGNSIVKYEVDMPYNGPLESIHTEIGVLYAVSTSVCSPVIG